MKSNKEKYPTGSDGLVDISSGVPGGASSKRYKKDGAGKKKKVIIIVSIAVAVTAALGVAGFCLFNSLNKPAEVEEDKPFTFTDQTVISGVDVTGMTLDQAKQALQKDVKKLNKPLEISINLDGQTKKLTQDNFTYTYNIPQVVQQAYNDAMNPEKKVSKDEVRKYTVTSTVQEKSIDTNVAAIEKEIDVAPKDAYVTKFHPFSENRFEYADAVDGREIDSKDLKTKLKSAFTNGGNFCKIDAVITALPAEVTKDFLQNNIVKLSSYETTSYNTANGTNNMSVALDACNGSIIEPGDYVWSFNECTGDSNKESNGYKPAHVISEGKIIDGVGGGICQASSTIYNAAIRANLNFEERYCHQWASDYVPTGLDATIDYPNLDLKISNPEKTQVFLECEVDGSTLHASFWGVKYGSYDEIKTHNEVSDTGSDSYSVRAWRVYLKDGKEIDREELNKSTYDMDYGVVFRSADYDSGATYGEKAESSDNSGNNNNNDDNDSNEQSYESSSDTGQSAESAQPEQSQQSADSGGQSEQSSQSQSSGGSEGSGE